MDNETKQPLWETLTMIASFALLVAWFVVSKSTPPTATTPFYWKVLLALSVGALLWILVRRMKRVSEALRENATRASMPPGMPFPPGAPPSNAPKKDSRGARPK